MVAEDLNKKECGRDVHTTRQVSLMAQIKQQIGEKYWKNFHYASTLPYSKVQKKRMFLAMATYTNTISKL